MYFTGIIFGAIADSAQCVDGIKVYTLVVSILGLISFFILICVSLFGRDDRGTTVSPFNDAQVNIH